MKMQKKKLPDSISRQLEKFVKFVKKQFSNAKPALENLRNQHWKICETISARCKSSQPGKKTFPFRHRMLQHLFENGICAMTA